MMLRSLVGRPVLVLGGWELLHREPDSNLSPTSVRPSVLTCIAVQGEGDQHEDRHQLHVGGSCCWQVSLMSEQKELTLEVSAQNASFYSPGHHANPSHKWGNESQDKPGIGPGNNSKNQQEPRQPIFLLVENWGDRVFGTPNNFRTAIKIYDIQFSSVQPLSHVRLFATPWTAACQASLSITNSQSLLKLMSIESVMLSNHLILCHSLLLSPSIFPSIKVFINESVLHIRWPKYWTYSFSISPSNEYSGLISFRMDWLDLLAVQGTL